MSSLARLYIWFPAPSVSPARGVSIQLCRHFKCIWLSTATIRLLMTIRYHELKMGFFSMSQKGYAYNSKFICIFRFPILHCKIDYTGAFYVMYVCQQIRYLACPPAHLRIATLNVNGHSYKVEVVGAMLLAGAVNILSLKLGPTMPGRSLQDIQNIIRSVTALPHSMDVVFWSGRRSMLGSSARSTRVGFFSTWAEAVTMTPRPLSLSQSISLHDRKGDNTTAACARSLREKFPSDPCVVGGV
jgi:hypothetical protein